MESKKNIYHQYQVILFTKEIETRVENKSMDTKGGCGEWDGLGGWDGICALLIECTSEDLL